MRVEKIGPNRTVIRLGRLGKIIALLASGAILYALAWGITDGHQVRLAMAVFLVITALYNVAIQFTGRIASQRAAGQTPIQTEPGEWFRVLGGSLSMLLLALALALWVWLA